MQMITCQQELGQVDQESHSATEYMTDPKPSRLELNANQCYLNNVFDALPALHYVSGHWIREFKSFEK